ncbi:hypothetical protein FA95DRAFT_1577261 [Auriscalpium vulgare]|uniref:Uncharacterized protein n=1 Tax=Auriscalpium vulgare TaxID=40419 RepID=A0ACB8R836_9AGAM|nr:hypothetical protein FA95DRAFT_1577261 [Auriscalpium vulgare]
MMTRQKSQQQKEVIELTEDTTKRNTATANKDNVKGAGNKRIFDKYETPDPPDNRGRSDRRTDENVVDPASSKDKHLERQVRKRGRSRSRSRSSRDNRTNQVKRKRDRSRSRYKRSRSRSRSKRSRIDAKDRDKRHRSRRRKYEVAVYVFVLNAFAVQFKCAIRKLALQKVALDNDCTGYSNSSRDRSSSPKPSSSRRRRSYSPKTSSSKRPRSLSPMLSPFKDGQDKLSAPNFAVEPIRYPSPGMHPDTAPASSNSAKGKGVDRSAMKIEQRNTLDSYRKKDTINIDSPDEQIDIKDALSFESSGSKILTDIDSVVNPEAPAVCEVMARSHPMCSYLANTYVNLPPLLNFDADAIFKTGDLGRLINSGNYGYVNMQWVFMQHFIWFNI